MASKFMKETSAETTFEKMFLPQTSEPKKENDSDPSSNDRRDKGLSKTTTILPQKNAKVQKTGQKSKSVHETRNRKSNSNMDAIEPHKYYLTKELADALAHRAYHDRSLTQSGHVRAALAQYLADDIDALRKSDI